MASRTFVHQISHQWSEENLHTTVETRFQERFFVNVWCGLKDNQMIGPVVLLRSPIGLCYLYFHENELQTLLEEIPLATRMRMYFQHGRRPAHSSRQVTHQLNITFPRSRTVDMSTFLDTKAPDLTFWIFADGHS